MSDAPLDTDERVARLLDYPTHADDDGRPFGENYVFPNGARYSVLRRAVMVTEEMVHEAGKQRIELCKKGASFSKQKAEYIGFIDARVGDIKNVWSNGYGFEVFFRPESIFNDAHAEIEFIPERPEKKWVRRDMKEKLLRKFTDVRVTT